VTILEEIKNEIIDFIKKEFKKYKYFGAVIGISGGIDSTVTADLLVKALGTKRVFGMLMPERDSYKDTLKDSKLVCNHLGIDYKVVRLSPVLRKMDVYKMKPPAKIFPRKYQESYAKKQWENVQSPYIKDLKNSGGNENRKNLAYYRVKHRLRMTYLYLEAEKKGYAVVGATNKTELKTGFYVKWGDESCDLDPILHLYKTQVFDLGRYLEIPKKILAKKPSPDIAPGIDDEYALGIDYKSLDKILMKIENNESLEAEKESDVKKVKEILEFADLRSVKNENLLKK